MAFVVTGNPGVGKHTIAGRVAEMHALEILDLNEIAISSGTAEQAEETLDVDVRGLKEALRGMVSRGALVVGHLAPYVLTKRQVERAIVLRKNPYKLDHTYKKRGYSKSKRIQNQGSEILGITVHDAIASFGHEKVVQIDASSRSVAETVRIASGIIAGGTHAEAVDWLGVVSSRGDMGRFFPTD